MGGTMSTCILQPSCEREGGGRKLCVPQQGCGGRALNGGRGGGGIKMLLVLKQFVLLHVEITRFC